jgi:hypothetical protein
MIAEFRTYTVHKKPLKMKNEIEKKMFQNNLVVSWDKKLIFIWLNRVFVINLKQNIIS